MLECLFFVLGVHHRSVFIQLNTGPPSSVTHTHPKIHTHSTTPTSVTSDVTYKKPAVLIERMVLCVCETEFLKSVFLTLSITLVSLLLLEITGVCL